MAYCIETQTLKGIFTAFYLVLTSEILPAGAAQGEEDFRRKRTRVNNLIWHLSCLHWSPSNVRVPVHIMCMNTGGRSFLPCHRHSTYSTHFCWDVGNCTDHEYHPCFEVTFYGREAPLYACVEHGENTFSASIRWQVVGYTFFDFHTSTQKWLYKLPPMCMDRNRFSTLLCAIHTLQPLAHFTVLRFVPRWPLRAEALD